MKFEDTKLPGHHFIVEAFDMLNAATLPFRLKDAVQSARILQDTLNYRDAEHLAAHLLAYSLPPVFRGGGTLVHQWGHMPEYKYPAVKFMAETLHAQRIEITDPQPIPHMGGRAKASNMANAVAHLDWLMAEYGAAEPGDRTGKGIGMFMDEYAFSPLVSELFSKRAEGFRSVIDWVGHTGQPMLDARYLKALDAVEKKSHALRNACAPVKLAEEFTAVAPVQQPEQPAPEPVNWAGYNGTANTPVIGARRGVDYYGFRKK